MEKFLSSYKGESKIFLGDTDSYTIIQNGFTEEDLIFKIKVATLLYDVVFIPAAYMWQSEQMKDVMYEIQALILTENVLPVIRKSKETRDVRDYFEKRENETKDLKGMEVYKIPSLASEVATKDNKKDMLFLDKLNCCMHLEEKSVKEEFINLWKNDLINSTDMDSISMILCQSSIDITQYKLLLSTLKNDVDYEKFSRSVLIDYILKLDLSPYVKEALQRRISWLYLKANAQASQSDFYLSKAADNVLVYNANLKMYTELLRNFGIDERMLKSLSIEELIRIKCSPEYSNFITCYNQLVDSVYIEQWNIIEKLNKQINSKMYRENVKRAIWSKLPAIYGVSSTIFVGLVVNYFSGSTLNKAAWEITGGVAALSGILNKLEMLNKSISQTSFIDFKDYIIREEYRKKMQKNINGVIL